MQGPSCSKEWRKDKTKQNKTTSKQTQDLENIVGMEGDAKQKFALASTEVHQAIPITQAHFLCVE